MYYKIAFGDDIKRCSDLLSNNEYFGPVDLSKLGGIILFAEIDGDVAASMWIGVTGYRAYIDYVVSNPKYTGAGARLLIKARRFLEHSGMREVLFTIYNHDGQATRIAKIFGAELDGPYTVGFAKLGDKDVH